MTQMIHLEYRRPTPRNEIIPYHILFCTVDLNGCARCNSRYTTRFFGRYSYSLCCKICGSSRGDVLPQAHLRLRMYITHGRKGQIRSIK